MMKNEKTDYIKLRTYFEEAMSLWIVKVEETNRCLVYENDELKSTGVEFTSGPSAGFFTRRKARAAIRKCKDNFIGVHITGGLH